MRAQDESINLFDHLFPSMDKIFLLNKHCTTGIYYLQFRNNYFLTLNTSTSKTSMLLGGMALLRLRML